MRRGHRDGEHGHEPEVHDPDDEPAPRGNRVVLSSLTALTPAFTDYEAEIEPTLRALMHGDLAGVAHTVPIYGGSLALEAPFSALGWLVGGDFGMYRATLVPGALAMLALATLASSWMRASGRPRVEQLGTLLLIAASPAIAGPRHSSIAFL